MIVIDPARRSTKNAGPRKCSMVTMVALSGHRTPGARHIERKQGRIIRRIMATTRLTQTQLVKALAAHGQVTNKVAKDILEALAATAIAEVKKNGVFVLPGIGRLVRVDRKARIGRNPATGESIKIPAKKVVKFRVAKAAKDAIVPPKKAK
jgi:DNA-binding protein HU-beta